jgi:GntR family phosphonate transport system transcriptional regulator
MTLYVIDRNNGEAVYRQISQVLMQELGARYSAGDCLPSEQELAQRFAVNRHTVRRAVDELVSAGLVERRHGKGTFVLASPVDYFIGKGTRFTETLEAIGKTTSSHVLRKLVIPARGGVAARLKVPEDEPVIWIETLRLVEEAPFCVISHFLPRALAEGVYSGYHGGSLHGFIEHAGVRLRRIESLISAITPQGEDATLLSVPRSMPLLRIKSVNVDDRTGVPVEYSVSRARADRMQLCVKP